jgi:acyl dehydratase
VPDIQPGVPGDGSDGSDDGMLENRIFDELAPGDTASLSHTVMQRDIDLFAAATGDFNPARLCCTDQ